MKKRKGKKKKSSEIGVVEILRERKGKSTPTGKPKRRKVEAELRMLKTGAEDGPGRKRIGK